MGHGKFEKCPHNWVCFKNFFTFGSVKKIPGHILDLYIAFDYQMLPPSAKIMQNFILMQNTYKRD